MLKEASRAPNIFRSDRFSILLDLVAKEKQKQKEQKEND